MPDVQVGDVVRVVAQFKWNDKDVFQNVYHMKHEGSAAADDGDFTQVCADHLEDAYTYLLSYLADALTFDEVSTYNVTQDRPMTSIAWPTLTAGSSADDEMPTQCAALVSFPTGTKKRVGKKYIPGFVETYSIGGGILTQALQTALGSFAATLLNGHTDGTISVMSGTYTSLTAVFRAFASAIIDGLFRTQRRRVQGVGG